MRQYSTIPEKEAWLLGRTSQWDYYDDLDLPRQRLLLKTLFRSMRAAGLYSPSVGAIDGRVSLRPIIERLLKAQKPNVKQQT